MHIGCSQEITDLSDLDKLKLAQDRLSMDLCNQIGNENTQAVCMDNVVFRKIRKDGNLAHCQDLDDPESCKDRFHFTIAIEDQSLKDCSMIIDDEKKNRCLSTVAPILAVELEDITICSRYDVPYCEDFYYYSVSSNDKSGCNKISDPDIKDRCVLGKPLSQEFMRSIGMEDVSFSRHRRKIVKDTDGNYKIEVN
jgi:hypothetical protein